MKNINLLAFGTFGSPNGFTQTFFLGDPIKNIKVFDIRGILKLVPNSTVYSIRKENVEGFIILSYSIYTFALEPTSSRGGSFIGSSILFVDKISEENITIKTLKEFHQNLVAKNVINETIKVNHSNEFNVSDCLPKNFDEINFHLKDIDKLSLNQITNKELVVLSRINDDILERNLKKSLNLLNKYDTVYFTNNNEIAEITKSRGIYKTIAETNFDTEINSFLEERKRKREQSISEFKREVERLTEDKKQTIQEFKNQIEHNERIHLENEKKLKESKEDINKIAQFYDDFLNKTNGLINQLSHNNGKLEEVKQIHNSNKILFNNGISDLKKPNYTTTISKPKPKGNLHTEHQRQDIRYPIDPRRRKEREDKPFKVNVYKVVTLVLAFLLISTWIYFLVLKSNLENNVEMIQNQEQIKASQTEEVQKPIEDTKQEDLKPASNSVLSENDYRIVANNLTPNMKLEDVVKLIFSKNPTEISSVYSGQEEIYSKYLLELNKQCFEEKEGIYYFSKDTLTKIPSYKKLL